MSALSNPPDSERLYAQVDAFLKNDSDRAFHGFFGRQGGFSKNVYASLNCGPGSEDDPRIVERNREVVCRQIGAERENLLTLYQVHGKTCIRVTDPWAAEARPEADAMVTNVPGLALGVLTADCAPVLFFGQDDHQKPVIGAAHAGWGGALAGVLQSTLHEMEALGAQKGTIKACIGPCIDKRSYEVGRDFYAKFWEEDPENERFFMSSSNPDHLMFDLAGYCAFKLYRAGLTRVYLLDIDTYFNEEDYFSYRRATHRGERDYGRQISAIMIR